MRTSPIALASGASELPVVLARQQKDVRLHSCLTAAGAARAMLREGDTMGFVDTLFEPLRPLDFLEEYWDNKPCLIRGAPEKVERLLPGGLSRTRLTEIVHKSAALREFDFVGQVAPPGFEIAGFEDREPPTIALTPEAAREVLTEGVDGLVTIWDLHLVDEGLLRFHSSLKRGLGLVGRCGISVFLHPPSGRGIHLHFDHHASFQLLVSGTKHWRVSPRPHEPWPRSSAYSRRDGSVEVAADGWERQTIPRGSVELVDVETSAGDVLYLPPGTWHETNSTGGGSMGVTFYFYAATFADLLAAAVRERFEATATWRAATPPTLEPAEIDERCRHFFDGRLAELRDFVAALAPDGPELARARQKLFAKRPPYLAPQLRPPRPAEVSLAGDELLRVPFDAPLGFTEESDANGSRMLRVYYGDEELCFDDPRLLPFARRLVRAEAFRAAEAAGWNDAGEERYSFDEVRPLLEALLENGLLMQA